jgi:D-alanyl-lipoteichoic acid acyltransferase DltB (MBOAT superfamily)
VTFVQWEFLVFLAVVYALYWGVPKLRFQNGMLALASCIFYGWVHPWFLVLLFASSLLDFGSGILMEDRPARKKLWLGLSMAGNLGMLAYFKYCDFFLENVAAALTTLGIEHSVTTLGIFLPVGISFYTFQTMSYSIDIYRGELKAERDLIDYVVFVTFFPQLVAGPVERAGNLLAQVNAPRRWSGEQQMAGVTLAMWGAFKKVCIADVISPYVDRIFVLTDPSFALVALGAVGFSIQILADFSGYTDIARGVSRMLGFELMKNFDHPYIATEPSDFWKRWHISFSSWIRDYVYKSVGGNRGGFWAQTRNTWIAMLTSGLWHGASWNFVLWGAYHAALTTGYRVVKPRIPSAIRHARWATPAAVVLMYGFTCLGWLIFRETHLDRLVRYATLSPFALPDDHKVAVAVFLTTILELAAPLVVALWVETRLWPRLKDRPMALPLQTTMWAATAVAIAAFVRSNDADFIYFQF